jgi:predicted nucleotidyltransferase
VRSLIEGYFIVTVDDLVFEVKGVLQPEDYTIAYLRYVPSHEGSRTDERGLRYQKTYAFELRENALRQRYPQYLSFDAVLGREIQAVPNDRIAYVLDPVLLVGSLKDKGIHVRSIQRDALELVDLLQVRTGIEPFEIGITGSLLLGLDQEGSDIDLVVYGKQASMRFYTELTQQYSSLPGVTRYSHQELVEHTSFRWGRSSPWFHLLAKIEGTKFLQGRYKGRDFFIRLVKRPEDEEGSYERYRFSGEGVCELECTVIDDTEAIFSPCKYEVSCSQYPEITRLASFRGRFTEHLHCGDKVRARGRLETVHDNYLNTEIKQVVLGEHEDDFAVPIE